MGESQALAASWNDALFRLPFFSDLLPLDVQLVTPRLAAAFNLPYTGPTEPARQPGPSDRLQHQLPGSQPAAAQPELHQQLALPEAAATLALVKLASSDVWEAHASSSERTAVPARSCTLHSATRSCLQS